MLLLLPGIRLFGRLVLTKGMNFLKQKIPEIVDLRQTTGLSPQPRWRQTICYLDSTCQRAKELGGVTSNYWNATSVSKVKAFCKKNLCKNLSGRMDSTTVPCVTAEGNHQVPVQQFVQHQLLQQRLWQHQIPFSHVTKKLTNKKWSWISKGSSTNNGMLFLEKQAREFYFDSRPELLIPKLTLGRRLVTQEPEMVIFLC